MDLVSAISDLDITLSDEATERILAEGPIISKKDYDTGADLLFDNARRRMSFFTGLINMSNDSDPRYKKIKNQVLNARNFFIQDFFLASYHYHKENIIQNIYNASNNSKQDIFSDYHEFKKQIEYFTERRDSSPEGSESRNMAQRRLDILNRSFNTLKRKLDFIEHIETSEWNPPTMDDDIIPMAERDDDFVSKVVKRYEKSQKFAHAAPDWFLTLAKSFNLDHFDNTDPNTEIDPRNKRWRDMAAMYMLDNYDQNGHVSRALKALELYWAQMTVGIDDIENSYENSVIDFYIQGNTNYRPKLKTKNLMSIPPSRLNEGMNGFFDDVFKVIKAPFDFVGSSIEDIYDFVDETIVGKVLKPALKNFEKLGKKTLKALTELGDDVIEEMGRQLKKVNFRNIVKLAKSALTIGFQLNAKLVEVAMGTSIGKRVDKWTGGLLGAYGRLNKVVVVSVRDGTHKVDWEQTLYDGLLLGSAVFAGAAITMATAGTTAVGDATDLDQSAFGKLVLQAGQTYATGGAASAQAFATATAKKEAQKVATDTIVRNTDVSRNLVDPFVSVGSNSTIDSIQGNNAFGDAFKERAQEKAQEVAKNRANQILKEKTKGIVTLDRVEKAYSLKDKNVEQIVDEAKKEYQKKITEIKDKATDPEYLKKKAKAEMDRQIEKKLNDVYGLAEKYGQDMVRYLFAKYGPQYDYDAFIEPNDFLQYQVYVVEEDQRLFYNVQYPDDVSRLKFASAGIAVLGLAYFALGDA